MKIKEEKMDIAKMRPVLTRSMISQMFGISDRTVSTFMKEIEAEVDKGRYGRYSVVRTGGVSFVNAMVLIDFMKYRTMLKDNALRKYVPEFNSKEVRNEYCIEGLEVYH